MNIEDAEKKLVAKGVDALCKKCGHVQMYNKEPVQILLGSGGNLGEAFTCAALLCTNCGHVDMFAEEVFNA